MNHALISPEKVPDEDLFKSCVKHLEGLSTEEVERYRDIVQNQIPIAWHQRNEGALRLLQIKEDAAIRVLASRVKFKNN